MQGNSIFSRHALRAALLTALALLTFGGSAPALAAPSAPAEDAARTILSRLVTLHEGAGLESFAHLDDALLDRIARTVLARGFSPMAQFTVNRANRPAALRGPVERRGKPACQGRDVLRARPGRARHASGGFGGAAHSRNPGASGLGGGELCRETGQRSGQIDSQPKGRLPGRAQS